MVVGAGGKASGGGAVSALMSGVCTCLQFSGEKRRGWAERIFGVRSSTAKELKRPIKSSEYSNGEERVARVIGVTVRNMNVRLVTGRNCTSLPHFHSIPESGEMWVLTCVQWYQAEGILKKVAQNSITVTEKSLADQVNID